MAKKETVSIASYLVAKNGTTKYLKLEAKPNADDQTKALVESLKALLGTDVLYVNLFDDEFRGKYKIPDFNRGRIEVEVKQAHVAAAVSAPAAKQASKERVDF